VPIGLLAVASMLVFSHIDATTTTCMNTPSTCAPQAKKALPSAKSATQQVKRNLPSLPSFGKAAQQVKKAAPAPFKRAPAPVKKAVQQVGTLRLGRRSCLRAVHAGERVRQRQKNTNRCVPCVSAHFCSCGAQFLPGMHPEQAVRPACLEESDETKPGI